MWNQAQQALRESMIRVMNESAHLLPGFIALVVAVLFSIAVAWVLAFVVRRLLQSLRFDQRLLYWGFPVGGWSPAVSPTSVVSRFVFWAVILIGFIIGIAAFDATLTSQLLLQLFGYVPQLIVAGLVLLAGSLIARFLSRSVLIGAVNMNLQYASLLASGVKWMVVVMSVAMALEHLQIGRDIVYMAFGILFGGIVLALVLAVGLGSKELVSRSLENEAARKPAETTAAAEPFRHF
jgi:hypothetical protein